MLRCPSCATDVPDDSRFCLACGTPMVTVAMSMGAAAPGSASSSSSVDEGRFPAGTVLAGRYRILGLVGRGGMGEVYRAHDTRLGQLVALKFLPEAASGNEKMLARLHGEVRIARQVSHPNVCRVYDVGEYQGLTFLTMEYLDGEDLASLLRRIGRLPGDKAVEIARRLCAGLAAAHDKGVLHRDLKPANVMIDGRGQVLITDFGLAALEGSVRDGDVRSGTPAYLSPEQAAGREVTARSDIFSLGLVMYEMFTGKRAIEDASRRTPASISTLVKDIDPVVERVILRCMAEEPRDRPATARAVAAALPGGDPLAAALAAGETPSPEMVAAAGETAGLPVRTAVLWLAATLAGLAMAVVLGGKANLLNQIPFESSTEALAHRARDLVQSLGYTEPPADRAWGFGSDWDFRQWVPDHLKPDVTQALVARGQPALVYFWYRQSPRPLQALNADGAVNTRDPPPTFSGMATVQLDTQGRLLSFQAVPPEVEEPSRDATGPADWKALFTAAGLEPGSFTATEPKWAPLAGFDARAAWTGFYPAAPEVPLRIEAASWRGKPVSFRLIGPWVRPGRMQEFQQTTGQQASGWIYLMLASVVFVGSALLAWHNCRLGRGDVKGAARLSVFVSVATLLYWACSAHHLTNQVEYFNFTWAISSALWFAATTFALYVGLEPYVRRRWPQSLISWTRLLGGGWRDPLVGEHLLAGLATGLATQIVISAASMVQKQLGELGYPATDTISDARHAAAGYLDTLRSDIAFALGMVFLFFLLRVLLRRQWAAVAAFLTISGLTAGLSAPHPLVTVPANTIIFGLSLLVLIRFGVLALVVAGVVGDVISNGAPTLDLSAWYSEWTILSVVVLLAVAVYGFRIALAGKRVLKEGFLEG